jgi:hypothetical protein
VQVVRVITGSVAFASALALMLVAAPPAPAPVPPRDCGMLDVRAKRYNIKADQLRCKTAVPYARTYLGRRKKPKGFRCQNYSGGTKLKFRCSKGVKVFFAIKH